MSDFGIKIITGNEEFHTRELGLKMIDFKIPQPDAKTNYVQIPGTSGNLDLSEVYGGVTYEDRSGLSFTFVVRNNFIAWAHIIQNLAAKIHGKKCKVIVDNDPDYYYICRLKISHEKSKKAVGTIVITGTAEPYKYDMIGSDERWEWDPFDFETGVIRELVDIKIWSLNNRITITGSTNYRTPVFVVKESKNMQFTYNNKTYDLPKPGNYRFPAVRVGDDDITLKFSGAGVLTIRFRGAYL